MHIYENIPCVPDSFLSKINTTALNLTTPIICDSTANSTRTNVLYDVRVHNSRQEYPSSFSLKLLRNYLMTLICFNCFSFLFNYII